MKDGMAAPSQLTGMRWPLWLGNQAVRSGILAGVYLSCVFVAWLVVANRVRELEPYAEARNLVALGLLAAILVIAPLRFRHEPGRLFLAGLTAWTLLTVTYVVTARFFTLLDNRMGALHLFMLGAVSYGFVAVLDWVFLICASVRHQYILQCRGAAPTSGRHRAQ